MSPVSNGTDELCYEKKQYKANGNIFTISNFSLFSRGYKES